MFKAQNRYLELTGVSTDYTLQCVLCGWDSQWESPSSAGLFVRNQVWQQIWRESGRIWRSFRPGTFRNRWKVLSSDPNFDVWIRKLACFLQAESNFWRETWRSNKKVEIGQIGWNRPNTPSNLPEDWSPAHRRMFRSWHVYGHSWLCEHASLTFHLQSCRICKQVPEKLGPGEQKWAHNKRIWLAVQC